MDLMEVTEKERLRREDVAARLHALADALASHNEVEFEREGLRFKVHVPDEVDFKLEIEIGDDERELEVELEVVTGAGGFAATELRAPGSGERPAGIGAGRGTAGRPAHGAVWPRRAQTPRWWSARCDDSAAMTVPPTGRWRGFPRRCWTRP